MARGRGRSGTTRSGRGASASGRNSPQAGRCSGSGGGRGERGKLDRETGPAARNRWEDRGGMSGPPPASRMAGRTGRGAGGQGAPGRGDAGTPGLGGSGESRPAVRQTPARPSNMSPAAPANRSNSGSRTQTGGSPSPFQRDGGRAAVYCTGRTYPSMHGLANQSLFVELEKDGVWKVSAPAGQRFGKPFLAGLEVWAQQVLRGEQPMLCKTVTSSVTSVPMPTPVTGLGDKPGSASSALNRRTHHNFLPPPPPPPRAAAPSSSPPASQVYSPLTNTAVPSHPITSLMGNGLPGLDTIGLAPGSASAAACNSPRRKQPGGRGGLPQPPGEPPCAAASDAVQSGGASDGGTLASASDSTALDFVSLLQVQAGIVPPPHKPPWLGSAAGGAAAVAVVPPALVEDNFKSIIRQQQQQSSDAAQQEEVVVAPTTVYRGLLAESEEEDGNEVEVEVEGVFRQPYDHEDLEVSSAESSAVGEGAAEHNYGLSEESSDYEESVEGEDDEGEGYFDDYEDERTSEGDDDESDESQSPEYHDGTDVRSLQPTGVADVAARGQGPDQMPPPQTGTALLPVAAAASSLPPPPPRAPSGVITSSPPLSLELMRDLRSLDSTGRLRVSLRLERQLLNDEEVELLVGWYQERGIRLVELSKLWLYDNRIGDRGASAVARALLHPALLELHLSHNVIGDAGAAALLEALPVERPVSLRPLWLRLEWNVINVELLHQQLEKQQTLRGLVSDVPEVKPSGGGSSLPAAPHLHDHKLLLGTPRRSGVAAVAVRLPWVACQKQPPSEAGVLRAVKDFYCRSETAVRPPPPQRVAPAAPASDTAVVAAQGGPPTSLPTLAPTALVTRPPPPPPPQPPSPAPQRTSTSISPPPPPIHVRLPRPIPSSTPAPVTSEAGSYAPGPLLLFPDTSALISMLGGNTSLLQDTVETDSGLGLGSSPPSAARGGGGRGPAVAAARNGGFRGAAVAAARNGGGGNVARPPLDWSLLLSLAEKGRFGRNLPLHDQVFIVVADSVMKQLDGLKSLSDTRAAVRRFMSEGLDMAGPAGFDFLTVLGAHEGEGLALDGDHGGMLGLAGSRSPWLTSRGQAVDVRIVEVALYYQAEVTRAFEQGGRGGAGSRCGSGEGEVSSMAGGDPNTSPSQQSSTSSTTFLPVILLSNDNAQIAAAKSHGLPAFRLSSAVDLAPQLEAVAAGSAALTSGVLRQLLAPQATLALGTAATRSLQDQFDCAVGTLRGVVTALHSFFPPLERMIQLAGVEEGEGPVTGGCSSSGEAETGTGSAAGGDARSALQEIRAILRGGPSTGTVSGSEGGGLTSRLQTLLSGLQTDLVVWEGVIRTHQAPSRVVRWAALAGAAAGGTASEQG